MSKRLQVCTFQVDGGLFGLEVHRVQEVLREQEITSVPLAPAAVRGLINLRGQIVTAIDLRRRLGHPAGGEARSALNVVLNTDDGAVSLLVDEIGDVVDIDEAELERPPQHLSARTRELIRGVIQLEGRLVLVLDTDRTLAIAAGG